MPPPQSQPCSAGLLPEALQRHSLSTQHILLFTYLMPHQGPPTQERANCSTKTWTERWTVAPETCNATWEMVRQNTQTTFNHEVLYTGRVLLKEFILKKEKIKYYKKKEEYHS